MSRRLDLGQFVSRSTIIAGTAFGLRDASPLLTPDLVHSPQPGNVWHTPYNIFEDQAQQEARRDKPDHSHHIGSHDFERRRAKINTSHFHESRFHPSVRNDGESGFMGGDTGFNSQSTIGMGTIYSSFSEGEHYEPSTAEVGKHGKVLAKLVSGMASDRQNGEGGETGKRSLRDLNTLEYQLRHFTSLSAQQQQEVTATFFEIASDLPPAPEGWLPDLTPEQMNWFLGEVAVGAVAGAAMALVYEATTKKGIKKALPVLASIGMLISACGGNVVSTATGLVEGTAPALKPPLADPNVKVVTGTPGITATAPKDLAVVLGGNGAEGGLFQTCEAEVARLQAQYKMPEGLRIPQDIVVFHGSDPNKWTPAEKAALVDGQGKSIAPTIDVIKGRIEKINPKIRVKAIWSGEGYVLHLTDENGKEVWAVDKNGIPSYRPDMITDTEKFRLIPDPPVDGEKRYVVANGCGVLGIFDKKGNMIAVYKPLANKWELFLPATATPAVPTATSAPVPTSTPEARNWNNFTPKTWDECAGNTNDQIKNLADSEFKKYGIARILSDAKSWRESKPYNKPNHLIVETSQKSNGGITFGYIASTMDVIGLKEYRCRMPSGVFPDTNADSEVIARVIIYVPVDKPESPAVAILGFTYSNRAGKARIGAEYPVKIVAQPDGNYWVPQQDFIVRPGQIFTIIQKVAMDQVKLAKEGALPKVTLSPENDAYFKKVGKVLEGMGIESTTGIRSRLTGGVITDKMKEELRDLAINQQIKLLDDMVIRKE